MKGRPRLFAPRKPFKRAREMKNKVTGWGNILIGQEDPIHPAEGAQDAIEGLHQKGGSPPKRPVLTDQIVKKRLRFCRKYRNWKTRTGEHYVFQ
jgi:hypothetical protein